MDGETVCPWSSACTNDLITFDFVDGRVISVPLMALFHCLSHDFDADAARGTKNQRSYDISPPSLKTGKRARVTRSATGESALAASAQRLLLDEMVSGRFVRLQPLLRRCVLLFVSGTGILTDRRLLRFLLRPYDSVFRCLCFLAGGAE